MHSAGSGLSREFQQIGTLDDLERVFALAATTPVLIYKHSLTCGSSAYAFEEVAALAERVTLPIAMVAVQTARQVSDEIARRLGVRHESPQVLLVEGGSVLWHTSHSGVTAERIEQALESFPRR